MPRREHTRPGATTQTHHRFPLPRLYIQISSCAGSSPGLPLAGCVKRYVERGGSCGRGVSRHAPSMHPLSDSHPLLHQQNTTQCDGKCVICDSYVRPSTLVRICDECTYSSSTTHVYEALPLSPLPHFCLPSSHPSFVLSSRLLILPTSFFSTTGNYGSYEGRCVICGGPGISDAYYCRECTQEEKDRDGCPKIVNLGASKTDLFYERKKYGFKRYVLSVVVV